MQYTAKRPRRERRATWGAGAGAGASERQGLLTANPARRAAYLYEAEARWVCEGEKAKTEDARERYNLAAERCYSRRRAAQAT